MGRIREIAEFVQPIFEQNVWMTGTPDHQAIPDVDEIIDTLKLVKGDVKKSKSFSETKRLLAVWNEDFQRVDYYLSLDLL